MPAPSSSSSRPVPWIADPPGPYIAGFHANVLDFLTRSGAARELPPLPRLVSSNPAPEDDGGGNGRADGSRNNKKTTKAKGKDAGAPLRAWLVPLSWPRGAPPSPVPPPPLYVVEEGLDEENPLVCDQCRVIGASRESEFFSLLQRWAFLCSFSLSRAALLISFHSLNATISHLHRLANAPRV